MTPIPSNLAAERRAEQLGTDVTIFHPAVHPESPEIDVSHPSLILVFGWMDAPISPLRKYVQAYDTVYPTATVVVVKSHASFFLTGTKAREAALQPLYDVLMSRLYDVKKTPSGGLLIHVLSNGGAFQLMVLHDMLQRPALDTDPNSPLEFPIALIIDSAPGENEYTSMLASFTASMRNPVVRIAAKISLSLAYGIYAIITTMLGMRPVFQDLRAFLAQPGLLPGADKNTPRVYFYSEVDKMVSYKAIESHLAQVAALGFKVRVEKFSGSQHVSHSRKDGDRYWAAVKETWSEAAKGRARAHL
ncbi:hypothetical protein HGRIS_005203 [Hohenbuehelia grisea]|uniref:Indole-diterpene biosynthesis protein PaxU n=1 Tax=Hohenbuehelia grisea TaxID=104357 RepID=A0ABR3JER4_9AGAR